MVRTARRVCTMVCVLFSLLSPSQSERNSSLPACRSATFLMIASHSTPLPSPFLLNASTNSSRNSSTSPLEISPTLHLVLSTPSLELTRLFYFGSKKETSFGVVQGDSVHPGGRVVSVTTDNLDHFEVNGVGRKE